MANTVVDVDSLDPVFRQYCRGNIGVEEMIQVIESDKILARSRLMALVLVAEVLDKLLNKK